METKLHLIQEIQEKLRNIFFDMSTHLITHSRDELLTIVETGIKSFLPIKDAAILLYNHWAQTYEVITNSVEFNSYLEQYKRNQYDEVECKQIGNMNVMLMPLQGSKTDGLLLLSFERDNEALGEDIVNLMKDDIEHIVQIINDYHDMKDKELKSKFLFELTSRFYSSYTNSDVLTEIITSIQAFYPDFSYFLLLSQDYEVDGDLPVKTIEYSDGVTKRVSGQAFISGEVQLEDRLNGKNTCLYAPLVGKQGVYGVLQIITPTPVVFPDDEIEFFTQYANIAGKAIENTTLYQNSKRLVADLQMINDTTHKLNSNLQLSEITRIVRNQIINSCNATQVGFIYYDQAADEHVDILSGSTDYFGTEAGQALSTHLLTELLIKQESLFTGDYKRTSEMPYRSVMAIPMQHAGIVHGLIIILHEEGYFFTFDMYKLMQSIIQHSTLAIVNTFLKDELEKAVITDYLTKLYARNYLDEQISHSMEMHEMGTLILFDIDDFKRINDTYGHHIGDDVIIQVANIITNNISEQDIAARWGGEELALYLPNTPINRGVFLARSISKQVEKFTEPRVTLSAGVSSWTNETVDSVRYFFIRADQALYEAKEVGKNCVVQSTT